ncbi:MAG: hypothetical protein AAGM22_14820 [Acidobacteriota bacterium]
MTSRLKKFALALCVVSVALLITAPASAQSNWIAGSKVTLDNVDIDTLTVDITGSIFYSTGVAFSTAFMGADSGYGEIAPAVDWGDGSSLPPYFPAGNGIPFDTTSTPPGAPGPVRAYRMAFSHTYAAEADYTVTVNSHFTGGFSPGQVFTGTVTTAPTPSYATFGGVQSFVRNTTVASLAAPAPPVIEIPTASEVGLLALALLLGTAGVFFLRR